jgi:hypothetical protein
MEEIQKYDYVIEGGSVEIFSPNRLFLGKQKFHQRIYPCLHGYYLQAKDLLECCREYINRNLL